MGCPPPRAGKVFSAWTGSFRYDRAVSLLLLLLAADVLPPQARLEAAALEAVAASCPEARVAVDKDLTRACQAFASAVEAGDSPLSGSAASFYASLESSEPAPVAGVAKVSPLSSADRAVGELFSRTCHFNRIGVAAAALPGGEALVCALTAPHGTDLAHLPGRFDVGASATVSGTLAGGLESPRLFVTRPGGDVEEIKLGVEGRSFGARVPLRQKGEHSIEILANGPGGPQVVAMRRVFAGIAPPGAPPPEPRGGAGLAGVEAAIARLRAARGLPSLQRDAELDAVAQGHSREMARLRTFAHVLPSDGSLADRLRAKGYAYRSAGENIGLSDDPATAHDAIVASPAHLANLLDPRHRRLGLGIASGSTSEGSDGVYLTEVLAAPVIGMANPAAEVFALVMEKRRKLGLGRLRRDPELDAMAEHEARGAALADSTRLDRDLAERTLEQISGLQAAVAELYVGSAPDEAAVSRNNADARWTRLGVGAIYASSREYGPGRLWVVLLYGR